VQSDLQAKAKMYETKAAEFGRMAREAPDGPQRVFYEVLADYCAELATDFRGVIAKRTGASLAAE
jgi:hypothetical protein